jgi:hypothetical protein
VAPLLQLSQQAHAFFVVELSTGQLLDDVRLTLQGRTPIEFYGRCGGNVPTAEEVMEFIREHAARFASPGIPEGRVALV